MTVKELFREIYLVLKASGNEHPHLEAGWILEKFSGLEAAKRISTPEFDLEEKVGDDVRAAVRRRMSGEPLAYVLGEKEFYGLKFFVSPAVLIPRPETELLVEWAYSWLDKNKPNQPIQILDLGTGSGCIGLTLLKAFSAAKLTAVDISKEALTVAKSNALNLGVNDRVEFVNLDAKMSGHLMNKFDLIVANPPYIDPADQTVAADVKKYEPQQALFSENGGLSDIKAWLEAIPELLNPVSAVGFEIGSTQGEKVLSLFRDLGDFSKQYILQDLAKLDRVVCGER